MPYSACCLQYAATLLPSALKFARFLQEPFEQRAILSEGSCSTTPGAHMKRTRTKVGGLRLSCHSYGSWVYRKQMEDMRTSKPQATSTMVWHCCCKVSQMTKANIERHCLLIGRTVVIPEGTTLIPPLHSNDMNSICFQQVMIWLCDDETVVHARACVIWDYTEPDYT